MSAIATVADIMERDVPAVSPDDSVETVISVLREHELPGVVVVDGDGRCVGIITEADLVLRDSEADLHLPHFIELFGGQLFIEPLRKFEARVRKALASTATDMMTADPVTVAPDASVDEAARLIAEHKFNRLPVVENGRLVGVVTRLDVLSAITR